MGASNWAWGELALELHARTSEVVTKLRRLRVAGELNRIWRTAVHRLLRAHPLLKIVDIAASDRVYSGTSGNLEGLFEFLQLAFAELEQGVARGLQRAPRALRELHILCCPDEQVTYGDLELSVIGLLRSSDTLRITLHIIAQTEEIEGTEGEPHSRLRQLASLARRYPERFILLLIRLIFTLPVTPKICYPQT